MFACTAEGVYTYANEAFAGMLRRPVEKIIGSKIWDVFSKKKADIGFAALREVVESGEQNVVEVRIPQADGDRYYLTTITPVKGPDGKTVSAICSYKDITLRHHAEEALREAEGRFRAFMDNMPNVALIKDKDLRLLFFNRRFDETFAGDSMMGKLPEQLFSADRARLVNETDFKALSEGCLTYEDKWLDKSGCQHIVDIRKFRIDQPGKDPLVGVIVNDITERKQVEQKARLTAEFLNSIVENIRT